MGVKESTITRVVGINSETEAGLLKIISKDIFNNQVRYGEEVDKTQKETVVLNAVNLVTNKMLSDFGLPVFDIPAANSHVFENLNTNELGLSHFIPERQEINALRYSRTLSFAANLLHEAIHFKSYGAAQIIKLPDGSLDIDYAYRTGLIVRKRDGSKTMFRFLNEAVTEELAKKYLPFLVNELGDLVKDELVETELIKAHNLLADDQYSERFFNEDTIVAEITEDGMLKGKKFTYKIARKGLSQLINGLFGANKQRFVDKTEIFNIFAKAMLTGNILQLGKLIDRTYGIGSFRKLGEAQTEEELNQAVEELEENLSRTI